MNSRKFYQALSAQLPEWVARGWVNSGQDQAILDYVATQHKGRPWMMYTFSLLGVLLLGSGVITFFAANWADMPKLLKLIVLFGAMWLAYGAAWHSLRDEHAPLLGQALLLLGTILFGANIMLIAQIYHIDSHFPNGVLLWSLGALLGAYLIRSQPMLIAAIVLGGVWTTLEWRSYWELHGAHWPFLLLWLACMPLVYRHRFLPALHLLMIALLLWSVYLYINHDMFWHTRTRLYLVQEYFLIYLAMFLLGMLFATTRRLAIFSHAVQRYSLLAVLFAAYFQTWPYIQSRRLSQHQIQTGAIWLTFGLLVLVIGLAVWHWNRTGRTAQPVYFKWGQALIGAIIVLIIANLFLTGVSGSLVAVMFNLLLFAGLLWLIYAGMHLDDRFMVNMGFIFFGLTLVTRYFDTFWSLLNRSYFFMLGGLVLIVGGYMLERKRRQLNQEIAGRREGGAA